MAIIMNTLTITTQNLLIAHSAPTRFCPHTSKLNTSEIYDPPESSFAHSGARRSHSQRGDALPALVILLLYANSAHSSMAKIKKEPTKIYEKTEKILQ